MEISRLRAAVVRFASVTLIGMGFVQAAPAAMINTGYLIDSQARAASLARVEVLLARDDVKQQLVQLGVDPAMVAERVKGLSNQELLQLEQSMDDQKAGGDILGLVGAVFVVLIILELVGVIDIFKKS
jgi:Family of unknown function (DUF6627)